MKVHQAKKKIKTELGRRGWSYSNLSAKTSDSGIVVVTIHDWQSAGPQQEIRHIALASGFRVEFNGRGENA